MGPDRTRAFRGKQYYLCRKSAGIVGSPARAVKPNILTLCGLTGHDGADLYHELKALLRPAHRARGKTRSKPVPGVRNTPCFCSRINPSDFLIFQLEGP
jgi:hypothetical protein